MDLKKKKKSLCNLCIKGILLVYAQFINSYELFFFFYKAAWNNQPLIKPDDEDLIWKRAGQIENVVI